MSVNTCCYNIQVSCTPPLCSFCLLFIIIYLFIYLFIFLQVSLHLGVLLCEHEKTRNLSILFMNVLCCTNTVLQTPLSLFDTLKQRKSGKKRLCFHKILLLLFLYLYCASSSSLTALAKACFTGSTVCFSFLRTEKLLGHSNIAERTKKKRTKEKKTNIAERKNGKQAWV